MADPQLVIDESRPMIEEFLGSIGIHRHGQPISDAHLLEQFSDWIDAQEIGTEDFFYMASRVGAFICEYLIDGRTAVRFSDGKRVLLRLAVEGSPGIFRDIDPYAAAVGLIRERQSLKRFVNSLSVCPRSA